MSAGDGSNPDVWSRARAFSSFAWTFHFNDGKGRIWRRQVVSDQGSRDLAAGDIDADGDLNLVGANPGRRFSSGGAVARRPRRAGAAAPLGELGHVL